jgi:hypothetical protein
MLYLMLRRESWQANHKRVEWRYCEERLPDVGSICVEWTPGCGADEDQAKDFDVPKPTISSGRVDATALTPSSVLRIIEGKRGGP